MARFEFAGRTHVYNDCAVGNEFFEVNAYGFAAEQRLEKIHHDIKLSCVFVSNVWGFQSGWLRVKSWFFCLKP